MNTESDLHLPVSSVLLWLHNPDSSTPSTLAVDERFFCWRLSQKVAAEYSNSMLLQSFCLLLPLVYLKLLPCGWMLKIQ